MYRVLTAVATIYGMFIFGSKAVNVIFQAGIAWPVEAATATALLSGYVGVMVYRAFNMQPDIVDRSHSCSAMPELQHPGQRIIAESRQH